MRKKLYKSQEIRGVPRPLANSEICCTQTNICEGNNDFEKNKCSVCKKRETETHFF